MSENAETDGTLDALILHSTSPQELMVKLMLAGKVSNLDGCVDFLIRRLFNGKTYEDCKKEKELEDAVFGILSKIRKEELVNKYLISKPAYGAVIVDLLEWMRSNMSFDSPGFVLNGFVPTKLNKVIGLSKTMMGFDPDFIPSLRDKDGNNMLMIFAKILKFDQVMRLLTRVTVSRTNSAFDEYVKNRYGCSFFRSFIVDMRCDPYVKNNSGECFANFFSEEFLRYDLGYKDFYK